MWAELVDSTTVDSRIWPNAAAIAELAWNPTYTEDSINLYKRIRSFSSQLATVGITHETYVEKLIDKSYSLKERDAVKLLTSYVKPISGYRRHKGYKNVGAYSNAILLTTIADMARPTSDAYLDFVLLTVDYINKPTPERKKALETIFQSWINQNEILKTRFSNDSKTKDWLALSNHLTEAGEIGKLLLSAYDKEVISSRISILQKEALLYKGYELSILPVLMHLWKSN